MPQPFDCAFVALNLSYYVLGGRRVDGNVIVRQKADTMRLMLHAKDSMQASSGLQFVRERWPRNLTRLN